MRCEKLQDLFSVPIYLLIFSVCLIVLGLFIVREFLKAEKVAKPFLAALFFYFLVMSLLNLIQMAVFLIDPVTLEIGGIYNTYFTVSLIFIAPIPLIYQIERTYFSERKVLAKYHSITLIILILSAIFFAITIPLAVSDPLFMANFRLANYAIITYSNWGIIVIFICTAFLYLGLKSSGLYRRYSLVIFFGWAANQLINAIGQLFTYSTLMNLITIVFIIKIIAAIVTAYGFVKLYALKSS